MNNDFIRDAERSFNTAYGREPEVIIRAPGRVNIIGEHTDYLGGLCMPMAIDLSLYVAADKSGSGIKAISSLYPSEGAQNVSESDNSNFKKIAALISELEENGVNFSGADIGITGDLPAGAGLASSAALIAGVVYAIDTLFGLNIPDDEKIKLAIAAEHRAGTPCGYMDPAAVVFGKSGNALFLDCFHEELEYIKIDSGDYGWIVFDSGVKRDLSDGRYEKIRNSMKSAAKSLAELDERITHPRILDMMNYLEGRESVEEKHRRFLDHYFLENERVKSVRRAFEYRNAWQVGNILFDAHESMNTLLSAGSPETDWIVETLSETRDVLGARVTGAGFGGSVIALMKTSTSNLIADDIILKGKKRFWKDMKWFSAIPSGGIERLK